jgi:hypothetical protein
MRIVPMRRILFAVAAFAAVLIYLLWWVTYAGIHFNPRFRQLPPGASGELAGTSVRVLSLTRADQLVDAEGGEPALPEPGAVWIVAELEAVRHRQSDVSLCGAELLGPQQRLWPLGMTPPNRSLPDCYAELVVGRPGRVELIFMVPGRYADQLSGISLMDESSAARIPVVTPP